MTVAAGRESGRTQGLAEAVVVEGVLLPLPPGERGAVKVPSGLRVQPHELETAERLAIVGFDVTFVALSMEPNVRNPDVTIEAVPWELKSPTGASRNTVSHQFERASRQSARLVLDLTRTPLDGWAVLAEARRRLLRSATVVEVMHISRDGVVTRLTRGDTLWGKAAGSAVGTAQPPSSCS